ncbi:helix-turn-helix domain-containing protein [Prescottella soli]|uniref:Helix-turn-helix domain-containing protein n=1 Tax=Prescottella soli TaxID=1543852 RepID=A0ABW9FUP2_9NOCA
MIRLSYLIESLGGAVVRPAVTAHRDQVTDVVLYEGDRIEPGGRGHLVLGPGIHETSRAVDLLHSAAQAGSCAVVLPVPAAAEPDVVSAAESLGVGLVELLPTTSWTHLVWLIRSVIDHSTVRVGSEISGENVDHDALFGLADAAAAIVGAPVTIEDVQSRVLAHSELQDTADTARISTIVGRRVPENVIRHFRSRGTFRRLHGCDAPIRIDSGPEGFLPRLVVPIRSGRELLGSIWVVESEPVSAHQLLELTRTASVVALHLVRLRAQSGMARRMSADRLRALLLSPDDGVTVPLPPGPWRVVALASARSDTADTQIAAQEGFLRRHGWLQPLLTTLDDIPIAVVTDAGSTRVAGSWEWLRTAIAGADQANASALAGGPARTPEELSRSGSEALELVALAGVGRLHASSTTFEEAWPDIALARARSAILATPFDVGPVRLLVDHDRERGSDLVATLATYLAHYGEPKRAARELHVHPNTLRYRMRQIIDLSGLDVTDHRVRLAAALVLDSTTARRHRGA